MECPHCKQQHPDGSLFCTVTGKPIQGSGSKSGKSRPRHLGRLFVWLFIFLAGAAGLAILAGIVFLSVRNLPVKVAIPGLQPPAEQGSRPAQQGSQPAAQAPAGAFPGGWSSTGPEGGDILCLVFDPADSSILYAGTNGQGIFKSIDGGFSWTPANHGMVDSEALTIQDMAIDPHSPTSLYAGTNDGVYKSSDGGENWQAINNGLEKNYGRSISILLIDPASPATLYAASHSTGLYKSSDGGESWQASNLGDKAKYISAMAIDPLSPANLYVGTYENLFKSTDGGTTWSEPRSDGDTDSYLSLVIAPSSPATLYAGTGNGVIKSTDGGQTWQPSGSLLQRSSVHNLVINPLSPSSLYALVPEEDSRYLGVYDKVPSGLYKSSDGGLSWKKTASEPEFGHTNCLAVDPYDSDGLFAGTRQGLFHSKDGGGSWLPANRGLTAISISAVVANPISPTTLYIAAGEGGVYKSTDAGAEWQAVDVGLPYGYVTNLVIDPQSPDSLYAVEAANPLSTGLSTEANFGIFKSTDAGKSWIMLKGGLSIRPYVTALVIDPSNPSILYAGTFSEGVFKTTDGGENWHAVNAGMSGDTITCLAIDPATPATLYAGTTEGFYKTTDGGENWVEVITAPDNTIVYTLTLDPNAPATLFAGTWPDGVYKSTDGGENWQALDTGLGVGTFVSLVSSSQDPQTLYGVGLNSGMGPNQVEGSLAFYVSQDGGEHWSRVETGLTDILAFSLLADPENQGSVYLGSLFGVFKGTFQPGN